MKAWRLRPKAQSDLDDISDYTARQWGTRQANHYIGQLRAAFDQLGSDLWQGQSVHPDRPNVLKHRAGSHYIIVRRHEGRIDIIRIRHERMNIEEQLN